MEMVAVGAAMMFIFFPLSLPAFAFAKQGRYLIVAAVLAGFAAILFFLFWLQILDELGINGGGDPSGKAASKTATLILIALPGRWRSRRAEIQSMASPPSQVTHHIAPDIDAERDRLVAELRGGVGAVGRLERRLPRRTRRQEWRGDPWRTDGRLQS
jgi:hypothetical protein